MVKGKILMEKNKKDWVAIIGVIIGLASIAFSLIPNLENYAFAAFLVSVYTLFHDQYSKTKKSLAHTEKVSSQTSLDVKNHLRVFKLEESPAKTFDDYVIKRLDIIQCIKNTSFNKKDDHHEADEHFNESEEVSNAPRYIRQAVYAGLKWQDIGDDVAKNRFRLWHEYCAQATRDSTKNGYYKSVIINNRVPYPNFLIITYKDNNYEEVLFNWDFRSDGHTPNVLVSNEPELVNFYKAQFSLLLKSATIDSDQLL